MNKKAINASMLIYLVLGLIVFFALYVFITGFFKNTETTADVDQCRKTNVVNSEILSNSDTFKQTTVDPSMMKCLRLNITIQTSDSSSEVFEQIANQFVLTKYEFLDGEKQLVSMAKGPYCVIRRGISFEGKEKPVYTGFVNYLYDMRISSKARKLMPENKNLQTSYLAYLMGLGIGDLSNNIKDRLKQSQYNLDVIDTSKKYAVLVYLSRDVIGKTYVNYNLINFISNKGFYVFNYDISGDPYISKIVNSNLDLYFGFLFYQYTINSGSSWTASGPGAAPPKGEKFGPSKFNYPISIFLIEDNSELINNLPCTLMPVPPKL